MVNPLLKLENEEGKLMEKSGIFIIIAVLSIIVTPSLGFYYSSQQKVEILSAGSMANPLMEIDDSNSDIGISLESRGSVEVSRMINEGYRNPDIAMVSDYSLIPEYMISENLTTWYLQFVTNEMVLAFENHSNYSDSINEENWHEILKNPDVRYGFGNPNADPGGYRVLMTLMLNEISQENADIYDSLISSKTALESPTLENGVYTIETMEMEELEPQDEVEISQKEVDLTVRLKEGDLDYMFIYRSVAEQHDLKYIEFSPKTNLGDPHFENFYQQVQVELTDGTVKKAEPISYGLTTIDDTNEEITSEFLNYMLSTEGRDILEDKGLNPIYPFRTNSREDIPENLLKEEINVIEYEN